MKTITFDKIIPNVFSSQQDIDSEIWNCKAEFEKGKLYLVEAESGKGKSTFCSYILGYRHDYEGTVRFDNAITSEFKVKDWTETYRMGKRADKKRHNQIQEGKRN